MAKLSRFPAGRASELKEQRSWFCMITKHLFDVSVEFVSFVAGSVRFEYCRELVPSFYCQRVTLEVLNGQFAGSLLTIVVVAALNAALRMADTQTDSSNSRRR